MNEQNNEFGARATLSSDSGTVAYYRLDALAKQGLANLDRRPVTVKILLENVLRRLDGRVVTREHVVALANWGSGQSADVDVPFMPARVLLQDFTGVPAIVDLAAMRSAVARMGGDPERINPLVPCDLVIDHSVQVDFFGSALAS